MTESEPQRCVCGHPFGLHKANLEIGSRNECWALHDNQLIKKWCRCRNFSPIVPAGQSQHGGQEGA